MPDPAAMPWLQYGSLGLLAMILMVLVRGGNALIKRSLVTFDKLDTTLEGIEKMISDSGAKQDLERAERHALVLAAIVDLGANLRHHINGQLAGVILANDTGLERFRREIMNLLQLEFEHHRKEEEQRAAVDKAREENKK